MHYRTFLNLIPGIIFFLIIKDHVQGLFPFLWLICLTVINFGRFLDIKSIQSNKNEIKNYREIRRHFAVGAALSGITYGGGAVYAFGQLPELYQLALICLLATLPPSGLVFFITDKLSFNLFFLSMLVPITIQNFIIVVLYISLLFVFCFPWITTTLENRYISGWLILSLLNRYPIQTRNSNSFPL